jgi:hypothetical protein
MLEGFTNMENRVILTIKESSEFSHTAKIKNGGKKFTAA